MGGKGQVLTTHNGQLNQSADGRSSYLGMFLALVCMVVPFNTHAADTPSAESNADVLELGNVGDKSDRELTALTAQWGQLSPAERRVLLAEVRTRMQLRQQATQALPRVTVTRRYGRIVRKSDGSVVLRTQVIKPRTEVGQTASNADTQQVVTRPQVRRQGRITFGFGFERRGAAQPSDRPRTQATPTREVENPAQSQSEPQ